MNSHIVTVDSARAFIRSQAEAISVQATAACQELVRRLQARCAAVIAEAIRLRDSRLKALDAINDELVVTSGQLQTAVQMCTTADTPVAMAESLVYAGNMKPLLHRQLRGVDDLQHMSVSIANGAVGDAIDNHWLSLQSAVVSTS